MLSPFNVQTVEVQEPTLVDDGHGNTTPSWPDSWASLPDVDVQPAAGAESNDNRDGMEIVATLFLPESNALSDRARVRFDGHVFGIVGPILTWVDPFGLITHRVANLKIWEG